MERKRKIPITFPDRSSGSKTLQGLPGYNKSTDLSLHGFHLDTRSTYNSAESPEIYGCVDTNLIRYVPSPFSIFCDANQRNLKQFNRIK